MAIKAGLVGVNPKGVDKNGMPIGSGGANVEAEIQQINLDIAQLQASKVGIGQLTANNKAFNFAYDSTTEKYGYKLDGTGDFIPFEGAGVVGINLPDATIAGLTFGNHIAYKSGGYQIDNNHLYLDITVVNEANSTSGHAIENIPNVGNLVGIKLQVTNGESALDDLANFKAEPSVINTNQHYMSTLSANMCARYILFSDQRTI